MAAAAEAEDEGAYAGRLGLKLAALAATVLLVSSACTNQARLLSVGENVSGTPSAYFSERYVLPAWAYDGPAEPPAVVEIAPPAAEIVAEAPNLQSAATILPASATWSGQLTEAQLEELLAAAGFPRETWSKAKAVAWCESKWSPGATGSQGERGLWQIHPRWHPDSTYDPLGNARAAYRISSGGYDWSAWSCG